MNNKFEPFGKFISEDKKEFTLLKGLRDWLKPDWRQMLIPHSKIEGIVLSFGLGGAVYSAEKTLNEYGFSLVDKCVLEVGCHNGNSAYVLAKFQDTTVHGIDILEYGILQTTDLEIDNGGLEEQQKWLDWQREKIANYFPKSVSQKVTFETVDVSEYCQPNIFDMVVSFDTLEHLQQVKQSLKNIYDSLKKGGVFYSEYNPFFSISGGHSLCTLDFPYGHCLISADDFERYIKTFRPEEKKPALNFYRYNLNRLTIKELLRYFEEIGFKIAHFRGHIPFEDEWDDRIKQELLPLAKRLYPDVSRDDMVYDQIFIVAVKE